MKTKKTETTRVENETWLALPVSKGLARPVTRTQLQVLPFSELEWENFERLCYRLAKDQGDAEQWAVLYGARGQKQEGIDVYVRLPNSQKYTCWQSKRLDKLTKAKLKAAIAEFEKGTWYARSSEFVICSAAPIQDTKLQDEIEVQTKLLLAKGVALKVLGQVELSRELKDRPKLVMTFFGREWTREFCPTPDPALIQELDAEDLSRIRAELLILYASNFSTLDPGAVVAQADSTLGGGILPLLDRYVEPDIEVIESARSISEIRPTAPEQSEPASSDLPRATGGQVRQLQRSQEIYRRKVSAWLIESDCSVIVGDAGFGKSTTLRAIALDLLSAGALFPAVAQRWPDSIPIVLPFAFWVRLLEKDETDISLPKAVETWFRKFHASDDLIALVGKGLEERKVLLLIDGLDEWSNEAAARSTIALLSTFVRSRGMPAILTGRPSGIAKLGSLDPIWRRARLASFSDIQQRALAHIWFRYLSAHSGVPAAAKPSSHLDQQVLARIDAFFQDLSQNGTLQSLAGTPLLLSGLISLNLRQVNLPRSRIQAYEELVSLLMDIHPSRRAQAALDRSARFSVLTDATLRKEALAFFAYQKRLRGLDAGCPLADARSITSEHLQSLDGAGLTPRDAIEGAKELFNVDADTTGLIVEKAPGEVGFVHAVFEETLVGLNLSSWKLTDQEAFVKAHAGDGRWTISILAMLYFLSRPSDVDHLLGLVATAELREAADVTRQLLVAEAVFGDFKCSARFAADWIPRFFDIVESESWQPHKEAILELILEAGASRGRARDAVNKKMSEWFPDPTIFRASAYGLLEKCPNDDARLEVLWRGLYSDNDDNKRNAAIVLSALYKGDVAVGERLRRICRSPASADTICAALEALMQGWWGVEEFGALIDAARQSAHPSLRLVGIRGRIKSGTQTEEDLGEVLEMIRGSASALIYGDAALSQALLAGWPNNSQVIALALKGASAKADDEMDRAIAKIYLLHAARSNSDLDARVGELIRNEKYFFTLSYGAGYVPGPYGPHILSALDDKLINSSEHLHNDAAHLAIMSRTDAARQYMISELEKRDDWTFWPVYALLRGWGMSDPVVAKALLDAAALPPERTQYFAHHLPQIIEDKATCRLKLLEITRLEKIERLDFLLAGFSNLTVDADDTEVCDAVLRHDFSNRGIFDATGALILALHFHPRVREIALRRLQDIDAPWSAILEAYSTDSEIRAEVYKRHLSLPSNLRGTVVGYFGRRAHTDEGYSDRLQEYHMEGDNSVRTRASIAYYESIAPDAMKRKRAIVGLKEEIKTIGPWMDTIRQAALAGFIALDDVNTFRDLPEELPSGKLSLNLLGIRGDQQIFSYLARHWDKLRTSLGKEILNRLCRFGSNEWWFWEHLAPFAGFSPAMRAEFLDYCAREDRELSSTAFDALARELPRSRLLREHCLRCLPLSTKQDHNSSPFEHQRREYVVGRILGTQFAGDDEVRGELEKSITWRTSLVITALAIGWKVSPVLADEMRQLRSATKGNNRYNWPDAAYLVSTSGTADEFLNLISNMLENCTGYQWEFLRTCVDALVDRLNLDDALAERLIEQLKNSNSPDEKASIPRMLALANRMNAELRSWIEKEFVVQQEQLTLAEFGLDLIAGEIRPVAYALLDALNVGR